MTSRERYIAKCKSSDYKQCVRLNFTEHYIKEHGDEPTYTDELNEQGEHIWSVYINNLEDAFQKELKDNGHKCVICLFSQPVQTSWCGLAKCPSV